MSKTRRVKKLEALRIELYAQIARAERKGTRNVVLPMGSAGELIRFLSAEVERLRKREESVDA